jgi:hypothetical protein
MARRISPRRERRASSCHGAVDICFASDLDLVGNERIVCWAVDSKCFAGGRRAVGIVDEEVGLEGSHGWILCLMPLGNLGEWDVSDGVLCDEIMKCFC